MASKKDKAMEFTDSNSRKIMGIRVLKNNHKAIRRLRKEHGEASHHGNKVWDSSIVLMDYLAKKRAAKGKRVLEIGCGWAVAAIYCAKKWKCEVAGLDIDPSVIPFAQLHAEVNNVSIESYEKSYEKAKGSFLAEFDLVLGGDICFWDELTKPLYGITRRAVNNGNRVILVDPGRPPFMDMAERACKKLGGELVPHAVTGVKDTSAWVLDVKPA